MMKASYMFFLKLHLGEWPQDLERVDTEMHAVLCAQINMGPLACQKPVAGAQTARP